MDVSGIALDFFRSETRGGSHREFGITAYQYATIGGGMTAAATVEGIRTPAAIVEAPSG